MSNTAISVFLSVELPQAVELLSLSVLARLREPELSDFALSRERVDKKMSGELE